MARESSELPRLSPLTIVRLFAGCDIDVADSLGSVDMINAGFVGIEAFRVSHIVNRESTVIDYRPFAGQANHSLFDKLFFADKARAARLG